MDSVTVKMGDQPSNGVHQKQTFNGEMNGETKIAPEIKLNIEIKPEVEVVSETQKKNNFLKICSLVAMTIQNSIIVLLMRYVRTRNQDLFLSTTAVVLTEVFKLIICLIIILIQERNPFHWAHHLYTNIILQPLDCLLMFVPSFIYTIQNNLFFVALSNLDAATVQVLYQLRIFTTCLFSMCMLGKEISRIQALAMVILFAGVSIVQLQIHQDSKNQPMHFHEQHTLIGLICVVVSCILSGFAGVYFEKILKGSHKTVWLRNVQLSLFSIIIGLFVMWNRDGEAIMKNGFFFGYDWIVYILVVMQSVSGLTIAVVIKYADNILKSFASSTAIVISCVVSVYIFSVHLSLQFIFGSVLVMISIFLYNK